MTLTKPLKISILSAVIFALSLTQNAITYTDHEGTHSLSSISLFLTGPIAFLGGGLLEWIVWLANPAYLYSIIAFNKGRKSARKASMISVILSVWFIFWREILVSESGRQGTITQKNLGFWLWLISILVLSISIHKNLKPELQIEENDQGK